MELGALSKSSPRPHWPGEPSTCRSSVMRAAQQGPPSQHQEDQRERPPRSEFSAYERISLHLKREHQVFKLHPSQELRGLGHTTHPWEPGPLVYVESGLLPAMQTIPSSRHSLISYPLIVFWTQSL